MDWTFRHTPLLTGKAWGACVHIDMDDSLNYDKVKTSILQKMYIMYVWLCVLMYLHVYFMWVHQVYI